MTPEAQRLAIADACGFTSVSNYGDGIIKGFPMGLPTPYNAHRSTIPDYLADLNAMHEAEKVLTKDQMSIYCYWLWVHSLNLIRATAAQRAEAFLKTIGKWVDE